MSTRNENYSFFSEVENSELSFCRQILSENSGSHILFFLAINGQEESSTEAFRLLYKKFETKELTLKSGKATFVLANPEAYKDNIKFIDEDLNMAFWFEPNPTTEGNRASEIRNFLKNNPDIDHIYHLYGAGKDSEIDYLSEKTEKSENNNSKIKESKIVITKETNGDNFPPGSLTQEIAYFGAEALIISLGDDKKSGTTKKIVEKMEKILDTNLGLKKKSGIWKLFWLLLILLLILLLLIYFARFPIPYLYKTYTTELSEKITLNSPTLINFPEKSLFYLDARSSWTESNLKTVKNFNATSQNGQLLISTISLNNKNLITYSQNPDGKFNLQNQNQDYLFEEIAIIANDSENIQVITTENELIWRRNFGSWQKIENQKTKLKPSLIYHQNQAHLLITNLEGEIWQTKLAGNNWEEWKKIAEKSEKSPFQAVFKQDLIIGYIDTENQIQIKTDKQDNFVNTGKFDGESLSTTSFNTDYLWQYYINDKDETFIRESQDLVTWSEWKTWSIGANFTQNGQIVTKEKGLYQLVLGRDLVVYYRVIE